MDSIQHKTMTLHAVEFPNETNDLYRNCTCGQKVAKEKWQEHLISEEHVNYMHHLTSKDGETYGVYITNFRQKKITQNILKSLFERFGEIDDVYLEPRKSYATLFFKSRMALFKALTNEVYFEGACLTVQELVDGKFENSGGTGGPVTVVKPQRAYKKPKGNYRRKQDDMVTQKVRQRGSQNVRLQPPSPVSKENQQVIPLSPDESWEQQAIELMFALGIPLQTSNEEDASICLLKADIQRILAPMFGSCETYTFGSRKTGMARLDSDVDVFVDLSNSEYMKGLSLEELEEKSKNLKNFQDNIFNLCVNCFRNCRTHFQFIEHRPGARIPIVRCYHLYTGVQVDISFKNLLSVWNSELIKYYIELDVRVRSLVAIIKYWLRILSIEFISSYTMCMMLFSYLQTLPDPIVPSLQQLLDADTQNIYADGWHCSFDPIAFSTNNTQNIKELLQGFFAYLANFDFGVDVLCCINGSAVPKWRFLHPDFLPEDQKALKQVMITKSAPTLPVKTLVCVQDVSELNHSTTKRMDLTDLLELRHRCAASSEYCASETSTLQGLFSLQRKPLYPPDVVIIEFTSFFPPLEDLKNGVNIKVCWMEKVVSILQQVFLHILHMQFVKEPAVSEIQINGESQMWSLISKYCLWENSLRQVESNKNTLTPRSIFQRERKFSQNIARNILKNERKEDELENEIQVNVYFKVSSPSTRIQLEIETDCKREDLLKYLQSNLQALVNKGLHEDYSRVVATASKKRTKQRNKAKSKTSIPKLLDLKLNLADMEYQNVNFTQFIKNTPELEPTYGGPYVENNTIMDNNTNVHQVDDANKDFDELLNLLLYFGACFFLIYCVGVQ